MEDQALCEADYMVRRLTERREDWDSWLARLCSSNPLEPLACNFFSIVEFCLICVAHKIMGPTTFCALTNDADTCHVL